MATRDLTAEFMDYRAAAIRKRSKSSSNGSRLLSAAGSNTPTSAGYRKLAAGGAHDLMLAEGRDGDLEMGAIELKDFSTNQKKKPDWVNDADQVETCLAEITQQMSDLQSMHAQRIGSVFGRDLADMEMLIERKTSNITDQFRVAERLLQKVGYATRRSGGQEATVGANVQRRYVSSFLFSLLCRNCCLINCLTNICFEYSLAKQLQELSVTFRQSQRRYLAEVQAQKSGGLVPDSKFGLLNFDAPMLDGRDANGGESSFFTAQQLAVVDDLTSAVQSRDEEIIKIAQSIEELGTIFKELAVLVIDQGTILDRIDYNMEAVVESTKTGIQQLEKAEKSQRNARPLRCIVCLSLTIFALLTILIIKHRPRRGWF